MPFEESTAVRPFLHQLLGLWSRVVRAHLQEESSVEHDLAGDGNLDRLFLLHIEGLTMVVTTVSSQYGDELSAALDELSSDFLLV